MPSLGVGKAFVLDECIFSAFLVSTTYTLYSEEYFCFGIFTQLAKYFFIVMHFFFQGRRGCDTENAYVNKTLAAAA